MPRTVRMDGGEADTSGIDDEAWTTQAPTIVPIPIARRCPSCGQTFSGGGARFCPFDGDPLQAAPDWNPANDSLLGRTIAGRYEVVSVLGEGGMGTIYEVRHIALDRKFALKVLRRDVAQDPQLIARFFREAKAAAAIGHPNIVAVSDFGELTAEEVPEGTRAGVPYFVMEHLVGSSLAMVLRRERTLAVARAGPLFVQCARALEAAHAAGVVHRDLKPDNIFLSGAPGREHVKLLDFGVAKIAGTGRLTRAGMVFGTPHYMSPEQAQGNVVDHRADIYALGVVMYECFAGRVPFESDSYMGVLTKHIFAVPEPIERAVPEPERLGALAPVVMRCLAKQPAERYVRMEDVAVALEDALGPASAQISRRPSPARSASEAPKLMLREPSAPPEPRSSWPMRLPLKGWNSSRAALIGSLLGSGIAVFVAAAIWFGAVSRGGAPKSSPDSAAASPSATGAATPSAPLPEPTAAAAPSATASTASSAVGSPTSAPAASSPAPRRVAPAARPHHQADIVDPWGK